jgi:hypothetical protein
MAGLFMKGVAGGFSAFNMNGMGGMMVSPDLPIAWILAPTDGAPVIVDLFNPDL